MVKEDIYADTQVEARPDLGDVLDAYEGHSYKIWAAISELVDNSIDSYQRNFKKLKKSGRKKFLIEIKLDNKKKTLMVHDNAYGMSKTDLSRALTIAKKNKWGKGIGKYGLGLKTSTSWFGKKWTVTTKELGSEVEYVAIVDINYLMKNSINTIPIKTKPVKGKKKQSYTTIEVTNGVRTYGSTSITKCKESLALTYQHLLKNKSFEITFQSGSKKESLEYKEPNILETDLPNGKKQVHDFEIDGVEPNSKLEIKGRYVVYPPQRKQTPHAGVFIFWKNRLIVSRERNAFWPSWGGKSEGNIFGAAGALKRQRFAIHLFIDGMDPTSLKDDFKWAAINQQQLSEFLRDYNNGHLMEQAKLAGDLRVEDSDELTGPQMDEDDISLEDMMESKEMADALTLVDSIIDEEDIVLTEDQIEKLKKTVRDPVKVSVNKGQPEVVIWSADTMVSSEKFMRLEENPDEKRIDLFINVNHPFYKKHIINAHSYSAYRRVLAAIALSWWSSKNREPPVGNQTFLKLVDNFLKGKAVMD